MFEKLLRRFTSGQATKVPEAARSIYDFLFCELAAFQPRPEAVLTDWQRVLFEPGQDAADVRKLANDPAAESRVRALAFDWLRTHGHEVPKGIVLGVIIERPIASSLDVLAAYADGSIRYVNHSGGMVILEPGSAPEANQGALNLIELSKPLVALIGPWDQARLPPPVRSNVRISFVVSDGLYFGEGPLEALQQDRMAAPSLHHGAQLLALVVDLALAKKNS